MQGVGFRPFVFRLAGRFGLTGTVRNGPEGVVLEAQGGDAALAAFAAALRDELPPLAAVSSVRSEDIPPLAGEDTFRIVASSGGQTHEVLISPDVASCDDCLADIRDPANRRHRYPFTNCTNCGPRYTITRSMPYDRAGTSMSCFPLCPDCAAEYADPRDRRFHAQPNACPLCGPEIWLAGEGVEPLRGDAALRELARRLRAGAIAAVKGLGGFHLVCDAASDAAVARLRRAKERPHKPLAIMVADIEMAARFVQVGPDEERLLTSLERPIVLCPAKAGAAPGGLSPLLSPDTGFIGVMLPYTPLHHLLLEEVTIPLVMTSGNRGGEPIALGNREALARLSGLAEVFLLHNRDILIRTDDSVLRPMPAATLEPDDAPVMHLRRARGFVPAPLPLPEGLRGRGPVLGLGAELKNTVCFSRGNEAFVSQHIGDLQNLETSAFQGEIVRHLASVLQVEPRSVVLDAHPDFVNQSAADYPALPRRALQHHFAHAEAVLAENAALRGDAPALVLALDGTGYAPPDLNPDGSIWGGELVFAHPEKNRLERVGSLSLLPLPGGEAAIRQPWRIAHGWLHRLGLLGAAGPLPWLPAEAKSAAVIGQMLDRGLNSPYTSSAGRLFDAVAALLGLCLETTYEGQAAIRLEAAQLGWSAGGQVGWSAGDQANICPDGAQLEGQPPRDWRVLYAGVSVLPCPLLRAPRPGLALELDTAGLFRAVLAERAAGAETPALASAFHLSLAEGLADLAAAAAEMHDTRLVGLSGGVMQNMSLLILLKDKLRARGLTPLTHHRLPPNDGCIAYGQAAWGLRNLELP